MNETPAAKLDWYVGHQVKSQHAAGMSPDVEGIAKSTAAVLGEMDRAIATGAIHGKPSTPSPGESSDPDKIARKESIKAESQAVSLGGKFVARELPAVEKKRRVLKRTGVDAERYNALCKRIAMLCKRSTKRRLRYGVDALDQSDFEYKAFALEIVDETMRCEMRTGIYKFMSTDDCRRVRDAAMERIADRSNGAVGVGWWVR